MAGTLETVRAGDGADEPAVGHVGEGGEVSVLAAGGGDAAAGLDPGAGFALVGVRGFVW